MDGKTNNYEFLQYHQKRREFMEVNKHQINLERAE